MNVSRTTKARPDLLVMIDRLLRKAKTDAKKIKGIVVVTGPGQFSSLRTSIAITNTFGFALRIPAVGLEKHEFVSRDTFITKGLAKLKKKKRFTPISPAYGKEPNITKPKALA
ncbi:hypothetical protein HY621_00765 [Candidatus Uhrbacteria bacterium]|nr:hypothetical protein [Candidatus Uhrbacteria bacterium]